MVELTRTIYGDSILTHIHNAHRGNKRPVQQALAELLGITQQQVSRIASGKSEPRTEPQTMAKLVRAWFWPQDVEAAIAALSPVVGAGETGQEDDRG